LLLSAPHRGFVEKGLEVRSCQVAAVIYTPGFDDLGQ
jgi:hypothetical protein